MNKIVVFVGISCIFGYWKFHQSTKQYFIAPIVVESPQSKKQLFFVGFKKRPTEALLKPYKNAVFAADLERKAGIAPEKKFYAFGKNISAIMHRALPPPQASMVSRLAVRIGLCFSRFSICFGVRLS